VRCIRLRASHSLQATIYDGVYYMKNVSAKDRMLKALKKGGTFTVKQARSRFGVQNVSQRIQELREEGWPIYTNVKSRIDGTKFNFYRMGIPNAEMRSGIADAYRARKTAV